MAEAEVVVGVGAAAEKRVRVVEGRRRKEARSLEAIVAVCGCWSCCGLLAAAREWDGAEVHQCSRTWAWKFEGLRFRGEVVCAVGGSQKMLIFKKHSSSVSFTFIPTNFTWNVDIKRLYLSIAALVWDLFHSFSRDTSEGRGWGCCEELIQSKHGTSFSKHL